MKIQGHTLYGLQPLDVDDIRFAWSTPRREHGGCLSYERIRQLAARAIGIPRPHHPKESVARIKAVWLRDFVKPWPQLNRKEHEIWKARYREEHELPIWAPSSEDPEPTFGGDLFLTKIDWDLTDDELAARFERTLKRLRPVSWKVKKTAPPADSLTAIAAQRLLDCRGDLASMRFVEKVSALMWSSGRRVFGSELRLSEAARRYRQEAIAFKIGITPSGTLGWKMNPEAYGAKSL